jgi:hypothetical protein
MLTFKNDENEKNDDILLYPCFSGERFLYNNVLFSFALLFFRLFYIHNIEKKKLVEKNERIIVFEIVK